MDNPAGWPPLKLRLANAATYVLLIVVNAATQTGFLGDDNATISARFPTLLTPAGWAFSIWGIIFLLQGLGVVYQFLPYGYASDGEKARIINTIGEGCVAFGGVQCMYMLLHCIIFSHRQSSGCAVTHSFLAGILPGYSWVSGWILEMLWQAAFQLQSRFGMWLCLALILGALVSFGRALLRLYGYDLTDVVAALVQRHACVP